MIGSLWMIVLDKKKDIAILKSMGMNNLQIRNTFLGTGFWLVIIGMLSGFALSILLYIFHKTVGLVPVPEGFIMDSYPASMRGVDFITVSITVVLIGVIASIPAARKAMSIPALIRE
jgi:lipoprotein-releasing system permease protein